MMQRPLNALISRAGGDTGTERGEKALSANAGELTGIATVYTPTD